MTDHRLPIADATSADNGSPITDKVWQGGELANNYLTGVRGAIPLAQAQIDTMLRLIRWSQEEVNFVLDLGCGDGILGQAVLDQYPDAHGVFADFSAPMLAAAQKRLAGYGERVRLVEVDYGNKDWRSEIGDWGSPAISNLQSPISNIFNVIVSGYSIHHQPDGRKRTLYAELYDLLTPGGIIVNVEHVASRSKWGEMLFEEAFVDAMVAYHRQNGNSQPREQIAHELYNRPDKAANKLTAVETQCDWLRDIGFIHVDCYLKYFELAVFAGVKPKGM
ncbi:MAG: class I SAM-dependent methyltransferase [Anaerolineae bacterium]|nr:class I SAM-dependent methyltransferase [Anaerolineae bacterium]